MTFGQKIQVFLRTLFNHKTPLHAKIIVWAGLLYGISPIDALPDILPLIGFTDDAVVIVIAIILFLQWTKTQRKEIRRDIIDV